MTDRKKPGVAFWATVGLVVATVGVVLWLTRWKFTTIVDVRDASEIDLTAGSDNVGGVEIWITGQLDGQADVWAGNWGRERILGNVNWRVYHDWFDRGLQLHYEPEGVTFGELTIRYKFH